MKNTFEIYCTVCGKGKGGAFRFLNHDKCAKDLQEQRKLKKKPTTTKAYTSKNIEYLSKTDL